MNSELNTATPGQRPTNVVQVGDRVRVNGQVYVLAGPD